MDSFVLSANETLELFASPRLALVEWIRGCNPETEWTMPPAP